MKLDKPNLEHKAKHRLVSVLELEVNRHRKSRKRGQHLHRVHKRVRHALLDNTLGGVLHALYAILPNVLLLDRERHVLAGHESTNVQLGARNSLQRRETNFNVIVFATRERTHGALAVLDLHAVDGGDLFRRLVARYDFQVGLFDSYVLKSTVYVDSSVVYKGGFYETAV